MKFTVWTLIACILLTVSFVSAKEISCYSITSQSWYTAEGTACENKLFNLQDLKLLTSNFDRTDCVKANTFCAGSDINKDGAVNGLDLALFTPSFCVDNCSVMPVCGDLVCEGTEACDSCESDCGACEETESHRSGGGGGGSSRNSGSVSMTVVSAEQNETSFASVISGNSSNSSDSGSENEHEQAADAAEPVFTTVSNNGVEESEAGETETDSEQSKGMAGTGMVAGDGGSGSGHYGATLIILVVLLVIILGAIVFVLYRRRSKRK